MRRPQIRRQHGRKRRRAQQQVAGARAGLGHHSALLVARIAVGFGAVNNGDRSGKRLDLRLLLHLSATWQMQRYQMNLTRC